MISMDQQQVVVLGGGAGGGPVGEPGLGGSSDQGQPILQTIPMDDNKNKKRKLSQKQNIFVYLFSSPHFYFKCMCLHDTLSFQQWFFFAFV